MQTKAVIFDMDGLLIDSEPLWQEAGQEILSQYSIQLTDAQYHSSTGLRTPEWIDHWFNHFHIDKSNAPQAVSLIEETALAKIKKSGKPMPGVEHIMQFFQQKDFLIGLASSSPVRIINMVVDKLNLRDHLQSIISAETLDYGKPHPQVFLECASALKIPATDCIVFEDSFNGMIAAKAAKMKCVVIPPAPVFHGLQWGSANLKLRSLDSFTEQMLAAL